MKVNFFKRLLDKFLNRTASEGEKHLLDLYDARMMKQLGEADILDKERVWSRIAAQRGTPRPALVSFLRVAAAVALILSLGGVILENTIGLPFVDKTETDWTVHQVPPGEKHTLTLGDGTIVILKSGSTLSFPSRFPMSGERRVQLQGEAFFDVVRNPELPFRIETEHTLSEVLGTSFNISTWNRGSSETVTLLTGKIKVARLEIPGNFVMLSPGEQAELKAADEPLRKSEVNALALVSWKESTVKFNNTPLAEVFTVLENWYQVDFLYDETQLGDCRISGEFQNTQLNAILENIAFLTGLSFEKSNEAQRIIRGNCLTKTHPMK